MQNIGAFSAPLLILLALAGGFVFAVICEFTRYPSQRVEGQLYFYALVCAVLLVIIARLILVAASLVVMFLDYLGAPAGLVVSAAWQFFAGPLATEAMPTFVLAFTIAPVAALLVNHYTSYVEVAADVRDRYATELELFFDRMSVETKLVYLALKNGKVYVGYVFEQPPPKPRREDESKYVTLWPQKSGYLDHRQIPQWTTHYSSIYERIFSEEIENMDALDFEIVVPLDEIVISRAYEQRLERKEFEDKSGGRYKWGEG